MQIVIDIPENTYKRTKFYKEFYNLNDCVLVLKAIDHAIEIPKGHGRLIDSDALEKDMVNGIKSGLYEEGYETFAHINDMDDCVECVKYAPTIIEADGKEE